MDYKMQDEMFEQGMSLRKTLEFESSMMGQITEKLRDKDMIYLVGCGSSLSTCYSAKHAINMISDLNIDVFTGYEFVYNKQLSNKNSAVIVTSQSGETADTLAALRKARENDLLTISISNEKESSMIKEAELSIFTRCEREEAILGTKTYITQLLSLYKILFPLIDNTRAETIIEQLDQLPDIVDELLKTTEEDNKKLAEEFKDEDIFYCLGSGPNFGLAYKLAMTMLMEGAIKHACPVYSGEFRHGLIERTEKGVPHIFLVADYESDELTQRAISFCENLGTKNIIYNFKDYSNLDPLLAPFVLVIPLEWFVYYLAHFNGEDPGSTRHIGKVRY